MTTKAARRVPEPSPDDGIDDIDAYIATLTEEERRRLPAAEAALDLAVLLYHARQSRGLSQAAAAELAGFHQQAVSRFERGGTPQWDTLHRYLLALGYSLELKLVDITTGKTTANILPTPSVAAD